MCTIALSLAVILGATERCSAQYAAAGFGRIEPNGFDRIRATVRTLLLQVDHLVDDMELDLERDPMSERLLLTGDEVRYETEHLASTVERTMDLNHVIRDFQEFDAAWHRLTRQVSRVSPDARHLHRNVARISQTDSELHRLLRVPAPMNMQELRGLAAVLRQTTQHLRRDLEHDLFGVRLQRTLLLHAGRMEEAVEHLESSIVRGAPVSHLRHDFEAVDDAWLELASSLREIGPMRFDHVQRAAGLVAIAEGKLRAALGFEPNPDQFTCFRPAPSEMRRTLPYAAHGAAVVIPNGWHIAPSPNHAARTPERNANPLSNPATSDLTVALGFLFGGDSRESKSDRAPSRRVAVPDDDGDHNHDRPQPPIRKVSPPQTQPSGQTAAREPSAAGTAQVPLKPTESAVQAKVARNLARLSVENRTAAMTQRTCPVSGELLGSRGTPIKVKVKDGESGKRLELFVCCDDCEEKLDEHPERYLNDHRNE
jgi:hypothetical protein